MQDLKVTSWQLFGHDRLYVNLPDGTAIGWADRGSGTITVLHPRYRDAVTDALARQVPDLPSLVGEDAPTGPQAPRTPPQVPRIPPMRGIRKRSAAREPTPAAEPMTAAAPNVAHEPDVAHALDGAHAPETAYESGVAHAPDVAYESGVADEPDGAHVPNGAHAPETASVLGMAHAPGPVAAVEPVTAPEPDSVTGQSPASEPDRTPVPDQAAGPVPERRRRPAVLPALTPANDLASRRPGAGLREQLGETGPGALVRAATGALRRHKDVDPRRGALAGERRVGAELRRLTRHGWRVLHSVPLPDGTEIGHLLIGPGGVFAMSTEHHPGASVRIGDGTLRIDDGTPQPYELDGRAGAPRAREALEAYCAFDVPVRTVLVFTGVTALEVVATPPGTSVYRERQVSALAPLRGGLTATQVERVYDVARNGEAWLDG